MGFAALLPGDPSISPGEEQRRARASFPSVAADSLLCLWKTGDGVPLTGKRLLIGAASFAPSDLHLLDSLNAFLSAHPSNDVKVDIFDLATPGDPEDLKLYFPCANPRISRPLGGLWIDGAMVQHTGGTDVVALLTDVLGPWPWLPTS